MLILKMLKFISNKATTLLANKKANAIKKLEEDAKARTEKATKRIEEDARVLELIKQAHADAQKLDAEMHAKYLEESEAKIKQLNEF